MEKKWYQGNASSEFHANLYPFDCFLFVCMLLNIMHLFGMKNAFLKVGTIYAWVCRELVFKSGSMMALFSGIFKILHISS